MAGAPDLRRPSPRRKDRRGERLLIPGKSVGYRAPEPDCVKNNIEVVYPELK
jgi:hypothetical protein